MPNSRTAAVIAAFLTMCLTMPAVAQQGAMVLPGARPIVDAALFESIQAALDAVPEKGGIVRLPPGDFEITEPLILSRTDTRIEGCGSATNIINLNENGQPAMVIAHADREKVKPGDRLWRVSVADLRITGNPKSGSGIHAIQIEEIFLHGITVTQNGGDGIRLDTCYEDPRVSDCLLTYNKGVGLNIIACHDIVVSANQFEENQDALHCIDSFNLCMSGNNLDDHLDRGVLIENTYGSVLAGNMIEECNGTAITLDRDCYGTTISANVIAHNGAGVHLIDAHGCAVSANTFTIMKTNAVRIGPASGRITLTGNNFSDSYIGNDTVKRRADDLEAAGVLLESTADIAITGNVFSGLKPKAVTVQGENSGIIFQDNVIVGSDSDLR